MIPVGYCQCGCGQRTNLAPQTHRVKGIIKGEPMRFIGGHVHRHSPEWWDNAYEVVPGSLDTPCWEWRGTLDPKGYANRITDNGRVLEVYRAYYERYVGPIPEGLYLDHLCRNRACVNPAHLEPVTHAENMRRGAVAKLNVEKVRAIRARVEAGETQLSLAREYGVGKGAINAIVKRRNWKDV